MNLLRIIPRNRPQTGLRQADVLDRVSEDVDVMIRRGRFMGEELKFGPNWVGAVIGRGPSGDFGMPGTFENLGWSKNIKTTVGMDWLHNAMGGGLYGGVLNGPATNVTATAVTGTSTTWTASALIGYQIVMPVTGLTTAPVYGNVLSNTTQVAQIDQWWTSADGAGTTPASTNAFLIRAGTGPARFMGITTNTGAPAVGDTALTGEETANGLQRALATFAHTPGATTFTLVKTWTAGATFTSEHKVGLFSGGFGASGGGTLVADTVLNADATLASGDTLAVTWTWTLPAAG
jgi:hypothetical protein